MQIGRQLLKGSAWLLAAQVILGIAQLGYAAAVSRVLTPGAFGVLAVATSATALLGLIANIGLSGAAARTADTSISRRRSLLLLAYVSGITFSGLLLIGAPLWARLWDSPEASAAIQLSSATVLFGPASGVLGGFLLREGRFAAFAASMGGGSVIGMGVGLAAVLTFRTATSLVAAMVVSSAATWGVRSAQIGSASIPGKYRREFRGDFAFGLRAALDSLIVYVANTIPSFALSRSLGAAVLGNWNRAVVVGQVPIESVWTAGRSALYPQFATHVAEPGRAKRIWTDLLGFVSALIWPLTALAVPVMPSVVSVLFGPQWTESGEMAQWIMAAMGICFSYVILGSALQSAGRFRISWLVSLSSLLVLGIGALAARLSASWVPVGVALVATYVVAHATQVVYSGRRGLVDTKRLLVAYSQTLAVSFCTGVGGFAIACAVDGAEMKVISAALAAGAILVFGYFQRSRWDVLGDGARYLSRSHPQRA